MVCRLKKWEGYLPIIFDFFAENEVESQKTDPIGGAPQLITFTNLSIKSSILGSSFLAQEQAYSQQISKMGKKLASF